MPDTSGRASQRGAIMAWVTPQWPRVAWERSQRTGWLWGSYYFSNYLKLSGLCTNSLCTCVSAQLSPLETGAQSCHMQALFKCRNRSEEAFLFEKYSHLILAVSRVGHLSCVSSEFCSPVYQSFCHVWMTLTDAYKASRTISMLNKSE